MTKKIRDELLHFSRVQGYTTPSRCRKLIGLKPCRSFLQNEWRLTYNPCVSWPRWRQKPVSSNSWWKPMTHNVDLSGGNKDIHHAWPIPESRFKKTSVPTAYLICSMYVVHTIYFVLLRLKAHLLHTRQFNAMCSKSDNLKAQTVHPTWLWPQRWCKSTESSAFWSAPQLPIDGKTEAATKTCANLRETYGNHGFPVCPCRGEAYCFNFRVNLPWNY